MTKKVTVYLDMDGTIADLYGQPNWLADLMAERTEPFEKAQPMTTEEVLLALFPTTHYNITVLSMTPKDATKEYCDRVAEVKSVWLDKYFPHITKRIYIKYGHNKNLKNSHKAILVDDNQIIRENYKGLALDPAELWGQPEFETKQKERGI